MAHLLADWPPEEHEEAYLALQAACEPVAWAHGGSEFALLPLVDDLDAKPRAVRPRARRAPARQWV